ncbi:MAG: hypothetical protein K5871_10505 [Lachnospiraceae bacterium]|nr:hypothetical protein [Lachnospiraceae bacterium]
MEDTLTKLQFITMLCDEAAGEASDDNSPENAEALPEVLSHEPVLKKAFDEGWIEARDIPECTWPIKRKDAARILHMYMQRIRGASDLADISPAGVLLDLYDCRTCVNHIAQVFLHGWMDEVIIPSGEKTVRIFDSEASVKKAELLDIKRRIRV